MSPFFQNPLDDGADIVRGQGRPPTARTTHEHRTSSSSSCRPRQVMHSVTKYINGHSDVVMGVLATNSDDLATRLRFLQAGAQ